MKKYFFALCLAVVNVFSSGESGESSKTFLEYVKVTPNNQAAYFETTSIIWGTSTFMLDLSSNNAFGRDVYAQLLSAINGGRKVSFTVDTVNSGTPPYCGRSGGGTPVCEWGARVKQVWLHKQ